MPFLADGPSAMHRAAFSGVLLDQISEGLVRFDDEMTVLACNRPFLSLTGVQAHTARGRDLTEFLSADEATYLHAALTLFKGSDLSPQGVAAPQDAAQDVTLTETGTGGSLERPRSAPETQELRLTWLSRDGRRVESRTVLFATWEEDEQHPRGRLIFNALIHDRTVDNLAAAEFRRLRDRVDREPRDESLGILAGGLAHDFNNVLTAIIGLVDVARLQLPDDTPAKGTLEEISKTADYAAILVRNLLSFAGRSKQQSAALDLAAEIRDLARWVIATLRPKVELEVHCAAGLPPTEGDREQLRQAVTNLILNAEEAQGPSREALDATGSRRRPPRIRLETGVTQIQTSDLKEAVYQNRPEPGPYLFVEVWDNGCGIERESLDRIFDPFFTSKITGRGLGLAAVKGIAASHRGFITVHSELDRGTSVRLYLPVSKSAPEPVAPAPPTAEDGEPPVVRILPRGSGKILVVDDEEAVRGIAAATLKMAGYEVETAVDGQMGWEMVRERPDDFVCILLDITMPRMTGDEMLARVRQIRPRLPVVLSSGFSSNEACFSVSEDPCTVFLKKPYRARHLKETIAGLIAVEA